MAAAERHRRHVRLIVPGEVEGVEDVNEFARMYFVPARHSPIFDKRYRVMMPWQYMLTDSPIRKILLEEMPDVIEVTDKYTLSILGPMIRTNNFKRLGRPMLIHFSCERMDDNVASFLLSGRVGKWISRSVMAKYTLPSFDFHIANSTYTAEEFLDSVKPYLVKNRGKLNRTWRMLKAPRIPLSERIRVCPRGVDAKLFTPDRRSENVRAEMIELAGGNKDAKLLLYAGRISPEKNIGLLGEMMKILANDPDFDFRLLIAGDGPQAEWLKDESDKIGKNKMILLGHLEKERLADLYANADVFVHPNPKEPFGIAPLEAMASGVATVAPRSGGILSYATDENCWLVEPNPKAFADAVKEAASNEAEKIRRTEAAVETARANTREHSTDRLFATYDEIYEDFLKRRELFTDIAAARDFDYSKLIDG